MRNFKMKMWWVITLLICQFRQYSCYNYKGYKLYSTDQYSWLVRLHYPGRFTTEKTPYINGSDVQIPSVYETPDFRIEEPHFIPQSTSYVEHERPYLNSPPYKNYAYYYSRGYRGQNVLMYNMACYCNTVYKRLTLLAGCAVITTRHVVTTATPTSLILRSYGHKTNLDNIFGGWYDVDKNIYNASLYFSPARIHIHPKYVYPHEVNISHPIPAMYDLAIIASQITFYKTSYTQPFLCGRAGSGSFEYVSTIPRKTDLSIVAGFQFIKAFKRVPMPWFRYIVHTKAHVWPCPKSDWHWFHCIMGEYWGKFGFDSGGGMGTGYNDNWRYDGLAGICAFSMKLRSTQTVHYFTVVDTYPVLDFMYDAFLGLSKCAWLDYRFEDTRGGAPMLYWGEYVTPYKWGAQVIAGAWALPFY